MDIVNYCNTNQGFMSAVLALLAVLVSIIAIWISITTTKKQNKIALFEKRYQAYYMMSIFLTQIRHYKNTKASYKKIIERLSFLISGFGITHIPVDNSENSETQLILYFAMYFDRIDLLFGNRTKIEYSKVKDIVNLYVNSLLFYAGGIEQMETRLTAVHAEKSVSKLEKFCDTLANTLSI